jgi:diguanylate cyclase (GGDEF)-like protein
MIFDVIKVPTFHADGTRKGLIVVGRDITERKQAENQLQHLAHYDPLTHLPNRMLLSDRLQIATAQSQRNGQLLAVCYLDLDGFKPVNDRFGHDIGDRLLSEVGHRLSETMRAGDSLGRLGGDEFVLLLGDLQSENECCIALDRVLKILANPYHIEGQSLMLTASIGVTLYPSDATDSDTLLRHADQAMYEAKQAGRNRYHFFDPSRDQRIRVAREAQIRVRQGLLDGEMTLYYQPKVNMRHGQVYGVEALIRWQHPHEGLLLPLEFLPKITESDIAVEIDFWVLEQALTQAQAWHSQQLPLSVSVNISARTLGHADFQTRLTELLSRFPLRAAHSLEIEILESVALDDISRVSAIMEQCRKLDIGFALDDFGTGYSSLLYLRHLPANILKIDQSFVRDMLYDPGDLTIIEGILGLADAFQCDVIAEGVEADDHGVLLLQLGCNLAQGYGIARPMPAEQIPGWIADYKQPERWRSFKAFSGPHPDVPLLLMSMEHRRWVNQLIDMIENESEQTPSLPDLQLESRECRFGRWYYGPGKHRFGQQSAFVSMEEIHERIHNLGKESISLCMTGRRQEAISLKPALIQQRDELLACLESLREY